MECRCCTVRVSGPAPVLADNLWSGAEGTGKLGIVAFPKPHFMPFFRESLSFTR